MTGKVNRDWFYKLASDLQEERLQSAVGLIKDLSDLSLPESNDEWSYTLNRLIKGLASDRNSARLGFSLCLTEVINLAIRLGPKNAPDCLKDINMFLSLLSSTLNIEKTDPNGKRRKGKEERGSLFGKLFGLQTLLADPLFNLVFFDDFDTPKEKINDFTLTFINELIDLSLKKNWIKEPSLYTVYQVMERLLTRSSSQNMDFIGKIVNVLDCNHLTLTNEGLSIYLLFQKNDITVPENLSLTHKCWKSNNPLKKGNLPLLSDVLREVSTTNSDGSEVGPKNANWSPRLHYVWDILLPALINASDENVTEEPSQKKRKKNNKEPKNIKSSFIQFPEFWQNVVDESFFNDKSSSERKYLGFLIFIKTFPLIKSQWILNCYSQNLIRSIINQSNDSKRHLHKISQRVLTCITKTCENNLDTKLIPTIDSLLFGPNGSINFDKLTKSKTINKLISIKETSSETLSQLIHLFISKIEEQKKTKDVEEYERECHFVLDTLLHIVRNHKSELKDNTKDVILPLLKQLVILAFFERDNKSQKITDKKDDDEEEDDDNESTKQDLSELAQERLYSILSELSMVPTDDSHSWQYYTLQDIIHLETTIPLKVKLDDSLKEVQSVALNILKENSHNVSKKAMARGLEALLSMCLVQLYAGDVDSISTIEELCDFYNTKKSESLVGITEILLSLLAQRKAVLTKTSLLVWEQFISEIGKEELQVVLDVLPARENKQGFAQLFEGADEYEAVESGEEDGENEGSDDEEDSEDSEDLEESEDIDNEDVMDIDRETTSALAKALNLPENIINENGEVKFDELDDLSSDGDMDDDEEEEESMDDEKMMELDDQLSQIFKRRKEALSNIPTGHKRKLEVRDSRETVIAFKQRMIDLLSVYIKYVEKLNDENDKDIKLENLIIFIEPMVKCIQKTLDRSLAEKISKLLKGKLFKIKINSLSDREEIKTLLKTIHNDYILTSKPGQHSSVFYSLCSSVSIYLSKILVESATEQQVNINEIIDIYGETTKQWMLKGKFTTSIFTDFYNWLSSKRQA